VLDVGLVDRIGYAALTRLHFDDAVEWDHARTESDEVFGTGMLVGRDSTEQLGLHDIADSLSGAAARPDRYGFTKPFFLAISPDIFR
jgi:hypothetical protein